MAKALAIARVADDLPGDTVHLPANFAGGQGLLAGHLSVEHDVVDLLHLLAGLAHRDGAGHVRAIAAIFGAKVQGDHVPFFNLPLPRDGMGQGAIGA